MTAAIVITSCHSGSSGTGSTSVTPALNSTETQLIGTWFEDQESDSTALQDTTFIIPSGRNYIQFTSDIFNPTTPSNYKKAEFALTLAGINASAAQLSYWYYDSTTIVLVINGTQYQITISGSTLTMIHNTQPVSIITYKLHK